MSSYANHPGESHSQPVQVSILIPTFNPEERILRRLLDSISNQEVDGECLLECVIIDNSSTPPLKDLQYILDFLKITPWARVVREPTQGLSFARIAGMKSTSGSILIFLDDDNVPSPDYFKRAFALMNQNPSVGIWGPGKITVEFIDPIPEWLYARARVMHNERNQNFPEFGCVPARWFEFYPIGMGQVMRRSVADRYCHEFEIGKLTSTDRRGQSMASAGDVQIVWEATKMGLAAGRHPDLAMKHLIPARRCTMRYLERFAFGASASYSPALVESFPGERDKVRQSIPSNWGITFDLLRLVKRHIHPKRYRFLFIELAQYLGLIAGSLRVAGKSSQHWIFNFARKMGFE